MNRSVSRRLLASSPFSTIFESSCTSRPALQCLRHRQFSHTSRQFAEGEDSLPSSQNTTTTIPSRPSAEHTNLSALSELFGSNQIERASKRNDSFLDIGRLNTISMAEERLEEPHHFHIYATKHNTHITLTKPNRDPLISVSCGNIGFRKAGRKHYDSAFQLAAYVMGRIQEQGLNPQIKKLEVTLRGFGAGREAVTKALLGTEGKSLRGKIIKVSDATRLKFGGTRSKKPRRLG